MEQHEGRIYRRMPAILMLLATAVMYLPARVLEGDFSQLASDFAMLHQYRMAYAQEAIAKGSLPGWYSRELCGTPFWSNVQNFPFIPTRLAVLWLSPDHAFVASVILSAMLAAGFTYLFARRLGMQRWPAAVVGWTFAASGFYASRIAAGHLPLLEAYPALPLLLWLVDRAADPSLLRRWGDWRLVAIAVAAMSVSLAGHPQLSIYALITAGLYTLVCLPWRRWPFVGGALVCGVAMAGFALVPMAKLVARSTRVLPLDTAANDHALPYGRLLAALFPWRDGFPLVHPTNPNPTFSYPDTSYFLDTVWYIGLWPWIAVALLLAWWVTRRITSDRRVVFIVMMGVISLLLALPWVRQLPMTVDGTLLRSPARLTYLALLGLALASGAAIQIIWRWTTTRLPPQASVLVVGSLVVVHVADLTWHNRHFIVAVDKPYALPPDLNRWVLDQIGDGRAAIDLTLPLLINRSVDDLSFFDSIMLARSYRAIMAMKNAPPGYNNQDFPASALDLRILRAGGARVLVTDRRRPTLPLVADLGTFYIYRIDDAAPRASFYPLSRTTFGDDRAAEQSLRQRTFDPSQWAIIEDASAPPATQPGDESVAAVAYERPDSDTIRVRADAPTSGYVVVRESFDPGWQASLNGAPADIVAVNLMFMGVRVPPGLHALELRFSTPGRGAGALTSVLGFAGMIVISGLGARPARKATP